MTMGNAGETLGVVVAALAAFKGLGMIMDKVRGRVREHVLVTEDYCAAQHREIANHIETIKGSLKELKEDVKDLNKRVQNGDIANRLAEQVAVKIKEHLKIK